METLNSDTPKNKPYIQTVSKTKERYLTMNASMIMAYEPPPCSSIWGDEVLAKGKLTSLIGQGGVGKSGFSIALAVAQTTRQREFASLALSGEPLNWLFLCTESGMRRLKQDLNSLMRGTSGDIRATAERNIHFIPQSDAGDIASEIDSNPTVRVKLRATIEELEIGVLVLDPWSDFTPDENGTKECLRALKIIEAIGSVRPDMATLIVAHAKTGKQAVIDSASNWSAGNAQRGNRALLNKSRCQIALVSHAETGSDRVLVCTKINDGEKFDPVKLRVTRSDNPPSLSFEVDRSFCPDEWRQDLKSDDHAPNEKVSTRDIESAVVEGCTSTGDIVAHFTGKQVSKSAIEKKIKEACEDGLIEKARFGSYRLPSRIEETE